MEEIVWSDKFKVGVDYVDDQHQKIFEYVKLIEDFSNEKNPDLDSVKNVFDLLIKFTQVHFRDEEKIMEQYNYSKIKRHIQIHHHLEKELKMLRSKTDEVGLAILPVLVKFMNKWLVTHIGKVDRDYAGLVSQRAKP